MAISKIQYRETMENAALDAAKARVKEYNQIHKELSPADADDMTKKYYLDFLSKLQRGYPYDSVTLDELSAIKNYDANKMSEYLLQFGLSNRQAMSPTEHKEKLKAADILPLLQGVAKEGGDWTSVGVDSLKRFGLEHDYDIKSKEGFAKLLSDIGEQQVNYDRAKLAQEAKDSLGWTYWPRRVVAPSAMQEFENAIVTGGDYDAWDAAKLGALDAGVNALTWEAPSIKFTNNKIANGIFDAMTQAGAEAGRQGGEVALSNNGQEFDVAPVIFAGTAGATRPALVGAIQQKASQVEGEGAKQFSRGLAKATRSGDPSELERAELVKKMKIYNSLVARVKVAQEATKKATGANKVVSTSPSDVYASIAKANDIPQISKLFGVPLNKDYTIDAKKVLAQYDKPTISTFEFNEAGKAVPAVRPYDPRTSWGGKTPVDDFIIDKKGNLVATENAFSRGQGIAQFPDGNATPASVNPKPVYPNKFELDANTNDLYRSLFPHRYADVMAGTPGPYKAGMIIGKGSSNLGGRVEPTFKLGADYTPKYEKTYKDEKWYKDLKKNNPRARKIIDEAFKKKEEDAAEEE